MRPLVAALAALVATGPLPDPSARAQPLPGSSAAAPAPRERAPAPGPRPVPPPPAPRPGGLAAVVFFWSSASVTDAEARPALLAALEAAAARRGARVLDLSPRPAPAPETAAQVARAVAAYDGMRFGDAAAELDAAANAVVEHGAAGGITQLNFEVRAI